MDLARGLKFNCGKGEAALSDLKPIVQAWYRRALPVVNTKDFDETWSDFAHAWPRARLPLGDILGDAWEKAKRCARGGPVEDYDSEPVRLLVSLCRELAKLSPEGHFFLSSHKAGERLGVASPQVLRWLNMLVADGVLEVARRGDARRANRYRWLLGEGVS